MSVKAVRSQSKDGSPVLFSKRPRQALGDFAGQLQRAWHGEAPAAQPVAQLFAANELHGNEGDALRFAHLMDHGNVRVLEGGGGLGFLDEAAPPLGVSHQIRRKNLEGNLAVEVQVDRAINDPHSAPANLLEDFVVRDRLANHELRCLQGFSPRPRQSV